MNIGRKIVFFFFLTDTAKVIRDKIVILNEY